MNFSIEKSNNFVNYIVPFPSLGSDKLLRGVRLDIPSGAKVYVSNIELVERLNHVKYKQLALENLPQHFPMKKLPYVWANFDEGGRWQLTEVLADLTGELPGHKTQALSIKMPPEISKEKGNYFQFSIVSPQGGRVYIKYGKGPQSSFEFDLIKMKQPVDYVIRASSQWAWMNQAVPSLKISSDQKVTFKSFKVRTAD